MLTRLYKWVLERARERSTWLGLITLLTVLGVNVSSAQQEAVVTAGVALAGAVMAFSRDNSAEGRDAERKGAE